MRIRKHLLVPQRFKDEWSQPVAEPHSRLQHHTITMPSASRRSGNPLWQRITLISNTTQSQSYQQSRDVAPGAQSPGFSARTLFPSPLSSPFLSSPLLSLHYLSCYILLSFSFFSSTLTHPLSPFICHGSLLPSDGYWRCD